MFLPSHLDQEAQDGLLPQLVLLLVSFFNSCFYLPLFNIKPVLLKLVKEIGKSVATGGKQTERSGGGPALC